LQKGRYPYHLLYVLLLLFSIGTVGTLLFLQSDLPLQSSSQSILSSLFALQSFFIIKFVYQVDALAIVFCLLLHFIFIALSVTLSSLFSLCHVLVWPTGLTRSPYLSNDY
jgi:hypothetical protein